MSVSHHYGWIRTKTIFKLSPKYHQSNKILDLIELTWNETNATQQTNKKQHQINVNCVHMEQQIIFILYSPCVALDAFQIGNEYFTFTLIIEYIILENRFFFCPNEDKIIFFFFWIIRKQKQEKSIQISIETKERKKEREKGRKNEWQIFDNLVKIFYILKSSKWQKWKRKKIAHNIHTIRIVICLFSTF